MEGTLISVAVEEETIGTCRGLEASAARSDINSASDEVAIPLIGSPKPGSFVNLIANLGKKTRFGLSRSHSAPTVVAVSRDSEHPAESGSSSRTGVLLFRQVFLAAVVYFVLMIPIFLLSGSFEDAYATFGPVDATYFTVVTLCTIGYGDIVPNTTFTKLFTCLFILAGFGFIYILLNGLVSMICDRQEAILLSAMDENRLNNLMQTYMIDKEKGRMRIRTKVSLSLAVVTISLAVGTIGVHFLEDYTWVDSFYLAVTSVTTVGYGDYAFRTLQGRCFAVIWLLVSTLSVTRAFLYLAEFRIDRRNRRIAKRILHRKITLGDLVAADLDNDGSISKSEFVVYKLKEMGRLSEKEIVQICSQFDSLDRSSCGKITLADLMENE